MYIFCHNIKDKFLSSNGIDKYTGDEKDIFRLIGKLPGWTTWTSKRLLHYWC